MRAGAPSEGRRRGGGPPSHAAVGCAPTVAARCATLGADERERHGYLCLAGPTASGKSAAALAIAAALAPRRAVEIVSVDSALVYRGMDIGTAKPSAASAPPCRTT
jgi:hypothetical protein